MPYGECKHHAPVAELVAEPLHHECAVGRGVAGGLLLLAQERQQVGRREGVEAGLHAAQLGVRGRGRAQLAHERSDRRAQLGGPADAVALPEREASRLAEGGGDQHPVVGDLLDAPTRGAEREHVADARLVDHLLVQLAHPAGPLADHVDGEHPAVGDRAAAGHGEPLRAGAAGERARVAVPDDARAELGELVGGVPAGEQVEGRVVGAARQRRERGGPAHGVEPVVGVERVEGGRRDRLLREDVERVGRNPHRLDQAADHPLGGDGRVDEVGAVLGEHDPARHLAHLVAGAPDPLQPAGDRGRRLHLHDEVHRAHVDAELQAGGRDDAAQPAGLEVVLDEGALLLADRTVMCAGEHERLGVGHRGGALGLVRAAHQLGRSPGGRGASRLAAEQPLLVQLVEPRGQSFGQPPRVREHDRGAVLQHAVDDRLLHVRPDRAGLRSRSVVVVAGVGGGAEFAHVLDRHDDPQIEPLAGRRGHDLHGCAAAEEPGDLLRWPDGRGQPDALGGLLQQGVEPLQGQREVRAAFGRRDGVHLVHDHRLDGRERLARLRREHQEQRLRRGDEDVRRRGHERAPVGRRGVAGAHADADVGWFGAEPPRGLRDADERSAEVALHVDAERLQRRDVEHAGAARGVRRPLLARQAVDRPEERSERLARAGRRDDQRVPAVRDGFPRPGLRVRGRGERPAEPLTGRGGEPVEHVAHRLHPAPGHRQRPSRGVGPRRPAVSAAGACG